MKLFAKKTKWIPLAQFNFASNDFIVIARQNTKTGMLYFKTVRVNKNGLTGDLVNSCLPHNLIDVKEQWGILTSQK